MPQVPLYDQPRVQRQTLRGGELSTSADASALGGAQGAQLQQAGQALEHAAAKVSLIETRDSRAQADAAESALRNDWIRFDMQARQKYQGDRIGEYKAATEQWWGEAEKNYSKDLNPQAQHFLSSAARAAQTQALASSLGHYAQVSERNQDVNFDGKMNSRIDWAVVQQGTAAAVNAVREEMKTEMAARAAARGLSTDAAGKVLSAYNSKMTVDFVNRLMRRDPAAAGRYLEQAKADGYLSADAYTSMVDKVEQVSAVADGKKAADAVWATAMPVGVNGMPDYNKPVDLFKMEQQIKDKYANDPARQTAGLAALRESKQAFDASQKEFHASNTNKVFEALDAKTSMSAIRQSDAWLQLPAKERRAIEKQLETEAHARESRALTNENRDLLRLQREELRRGIEGAGEYMDYTNPDVLAKMTREEVKASRVRIGAAKAEHLLNRWDALKSAEGKVDARMDKDDFHRIASDLGINVNARKGSNDFAQLGDLHYRVEQVLLAAQRQVGPKQLSREDKQRIVTDAIAKQVVVQGSVFGSDNVSVMQLTAAQLKRVIVPQDQKAYLSEKLRRGYEETRGRDPAFFPTEENLKRIYVRSVSPAGALIPNDK